MVTWTSDGGVSGYSPTTRKLERGLYHLASTGTVDLNGATRFQYQLTPDLENFVTVTIPVNFTEAERFDLTDFYPVFSAAVYLVKASAFPAGTTPTPAQIVGSPQVRVLRGDLYTQDAGNITFTVKFTLLGTPDTKFWLLACPTRIQDFNQPASVSNDSPYKLDTSGRAISLWTNRKPAAPVITSPAAKSAPAAGSIINFAFTTNDPDKATPDDAERANSDLAGVQIQYAPLPTQSNPNPFWRDLVYTDSAGKQNVASWVIGQQDPTPGRKFVSDRGLPILCGADSAPVLTGSLPGGDWQLRVRTADFGSPYPLAVNSIDNSSPGQWSMSNYPESNKSPWSAPVVVSIPSQVPPPNPISPVGNTAIGEGPVRLTWLYRNTKSPSATPPGPSPQAQRVVQIRKVGDESWSSVFAGASTTSYVDLPKTIDNPAPTPSAEYQPDPGFESGTLGGWTGQGDSDEIPVANRSASPSNTGSHSGNKYLGSSFYAHYYNGSLLGYNAGFVRYFNFNNALHTQFDFASWVGVGTSTSSFITQIFWLDSTGTPLGSALVNKTVERPSGGWSTFWHSITFSASRPAGATQVIVSIRAIGDNATGELRLDDVTLVGSNPNSLNDFTMSATNQYEWRVQAVDGDGVRSSFSQPARFWMVPRPASGSVMPIPTETIKGATLGCGTHRVFLYRRGGKQRIGEITNVTYVDWGRTRDDISTAKIVVTGWDKKLAALLEIIEPWAYEIVIFRDNGFGPPERVWEGPVMLPAFHTDKVVIHARDVLGYAYRRILRQALSYLTDGGTVVSRAAQVLQNGFAADDPNVLAYLQVISQASDPTHRRNTPEYSRTVFEELDDMASNSGLDYVAVGRAILVWGTRNTIGTLPEFNDFHLGDSPIVSVYGMSFANRYAISDGNGIWGAAERGMVSGNDPKYGLVEMLSSSWASDGPEDTGTYTQAGKASVIKSFEESSESSVSSKYPPPAVVRVPDNTTISPDTPVSIQQLVPGVSIPLRSVATLRKVDTLQKLDSIKVTEEDGVETVKIVMSPFPRTIAESTGEGEES
jgi:hypothetical protein